MNVLRPLFKLDTKTQRGFMACVKWEHLEMATREETILLEIKLATLHHYFDIAWNTAEVVNKNRLSLFLILVRWRCPILFNGITLEKTDVMI